jgi:hypothetical protein
MPAKGEAGLSRLLDRVRNRGNARENKSHLNPGDMSALKWMLTLVVTASLFASSAAAQDKLFFSTQYPAAGVSLPSTTPTAQGSVPSVKSPRVVSSDDLKGEPEAEAQTITPRAPNLTQFGVDFDRRHPELFTAQPGLETGKQQLNQGEGSPTPTPTSSPSPSPTPLRIKVGRRVYIVNPNSNLQPGANPTATPIVIVVQPSK